MQPSARAGLYALKPTIGSAELGGIFPVSEDFDALGGMAKSVLDLAHLTELVLAREERAKLPPDGYLSFLKFSFSELRRWIRRSRTLELAREWPAPARQLTPTAGKFIQDMASCCS